MEFNIDLKIEQILLGNPGEITTKKKLISGTFLAILAAKGKRNKI